MKNITGFMKKIMSVVFVISILFGALYGVGVANNNRDKDWPLQDEIESRLNKSIQWLLANEDALLADNNPMLWWMVYETARLGGDERIKHLIEQYQQRHVSSKTSFWRPLFGGDRYSGIASWQLESFPYYNKHFIYALNCANSLIHEFPIVAEQNRADFCHHYPWFYRPACITHQLMGMYFVQQQQCLDRTVTEDVIKSLQQDIVLQLSWDIRVVDVYLQRVMMLMVTDAASLIKPIWIHQVLEAQLDDGGWGDFDPLLSLPGQRYLGFSSRIVSIAKPRSSFHATAQGVYLLTMLVNPAVSK